jgi:hypothetical protein
METRNAEVREAVMAAIAQIQRSRLDNPVRTRTRWPHSKEMQDDD